MREPTVDIDACAALASEAADRAGEVLLHYFGRAAVEFKGEIDLVTEGDRAAERIILEMIRQRFPDHAILAEESGEHDGEAPARWIVDPLDGTTNYAHGLPIFAVSIAVEVEGRLQVGVVYNPATGEKFEARRGCGAVRNGRPIRVSTTGDLGRSLLVTGFAYNVRRTDENNLDHFANFLGRSQGLRRLGSAALDLCYVASGAFDGYWETQLNPWDLAAGWLIVEEAGGVVTDLSGRQLTLGANQILASNGRIHEAMLAVLRQGKSGMR